jgi:hypothetical protein
MWYCQQSRTGPAVTYVDRDTVALQVSSNSSTNQGGLCRFNDRDRP